MVRPKKGTIASERASEKFRQTMLAKYGENYREYFVKLGAKGGRAGRTGGFASNKVGADGLTGSERARKVGAIGGKISKRHKKVPLSS